MGTSTKILRELLQVFKTAKRLYLLPLREKESKLSLIRDNKNKDKTYLPISLRKSSNLIFTLKEIKKS